MENNGSKVNNEYLTLKPSITNLVSITMNRRTSHLEVGLTSLSSWMGLDISPNIVLTCFQQQDKDGAVVTGPGIGDTHMSLEHVPPEHYSAQQTDLSCLSFNYLTKLLHLIATYHL